MRISDWSSDVCSSDLDVGAAFLGVARLRTEQAAVAGLLPPTFVIGLVRLVGRELAVEAHDGGGHQRPAGQVTGVIGEVAGREVVEIGRAAGRVQVGQYE